MAFETLSDFFLWMKTLTNAMHSIFAILKYENCPTFCGSNSLSVSVLSVLTDKLVMINNHHRQGHRNAILDHKRKGFPVSIVIPS